MRERGQKKRGGGAHERSARVELDSGEQRTDNCDSILSGLGERFF